MTGREQGFSSRPTSPLAGRRHDVPPWDESIKPGDYGHWPVRNQEAEWWVAVPFGSADGGAYLKHAVTEHADGTITAEPSILVHPGGAYEGFHGWLKDGVWTW